MRVKCPVCKGPPNKMWFSHLDTSKPRYKYAVFVVECWAGNLNIVSKYHYFQARVKLLRDVEVDQIQELEQEIEVLRNKLVELEAEN